MNEYNIDNLQMLSDLDLHDSKLGEILCNYDKHEVTIPLELDTPIKRNVKAKLTFKKVKKLTVDILEPWGAGIYIHEVQLVNQSLKEDGYFEIILLINSGDTIRVVSDEINYLEE